MPTWGELSNFTWGDLSSLKWANISEDKYSLLQKFWNKEIYLTPEAEIKLKEMCKPFADEFQKHYGKKFDFKILLTSALTFLQVLQEFRTLYTELAPLLRELLDNVLDFLSSYFS